LLLFLATDYCWVCLLQHSAITYKSSFSSQSLVKRTGKAVAECNQKLCLLNQVLKLSCLWGSAFSWCHRFHSCTVGGALICIYV